LEVSLWNLNKKLHILVYICVVEKNKTKRRKIGFISDNYNGKHRNIPGKFRTEEPVPSIRLKGKEKKEYNSNI
jgi:hypothetical protein